MSNVHRLVKQIDAGWVDEDWSWLALLTPVGMTTLYLRVVKPDIPLPCCGRTTETMGHKPCGLPVGHFSADIPCIGISGNQRIVHVTDREPGGSHESLI